MMIIIIIIDRQTNKQTNNFTCVKMKAISVKDNTDNSKGFGESKTHERKTTTTTMLRRR